MTEKDRIAELEAKLTAMQANVGTGQDPEILAKAKDRARMSWQDIQFVLEYVGYDELGREDIKDIQEALIQRKYDQLSGANRTALSWNA